MIARFFVKGLVFGLSIAAPIGPIGVLCIRRTLKDGMLIGLVSGLGAAAADATYGCVAGFGLSAVSNYIAGHQNRIGLIGGALLCFLGVKTFLSKAASPAAPSSGDVRLLNAWGSTFVLTLGNPATLLSFAAAFGAFGLGVSGGSAAAGLLVSGVFLGSAAWWLALCALVSRFRTQISPTGMRPINWVSGTVLIVFGIYAVALY
jgi:threonine/homoserine/homoserine lactone efflux protein